MSLLRRSVAKAVPVANALVPYPLGRYPCSLPKLDTDLSDYIDRRPISIRYRVTAMIEMSNLDEAWRISRLAVLDKYRVDRDTVFICNSVIGAMCSAKRYDEAMYMFNYFFNEYKTLPNMLSLNLIIKAHCDQGRVDDALHLYRHILSLSPSMETYRILTKALVDARRLDEACDLVASMSRCDFVVYNSLIRGFLDIGKYVRANQLFEQLKGKLPWRDYHKAIAIFNVSFMNYWFKQGKDEEAMEIFATLEQAELLNTIAGNWVLEVLVEHGKTTEAWELFREMIEISDSETVDIIMSKDFSQKLTLPLMDRVRSRCYPTMIARFCELGFMSEAEELFAEMFSGEDFLPGPDVSTFRAMINGYVKVGRVDDAIKTLNKLKISNLRKLAIHRAT